MATQEKSEGILPFARLVGYIPLELHQRLRNSMLHCVGLNYFGDNDSPLRIGDVIAEQDDLLVQYKLVNLLPNGKAKFLLLDKNQLVRYEFIAGFIKLRVKIPKN